MGRNTQGVRLINIKEDDEVATLARVEKSEGSRRSVDDEEENE